ncbi:MAG: acetyl-CoA carboxylase biotin carboxylase subunit [bacterium]|nr:acetyl-CoA carboxylase biotin carboxylase subunit [bacterium]
MLKKCLIANRGEIAVRLIRACQELGIQTVAVYSDPDARARHVFLADEAYPLGGNSAKESYLLGELLIEIALKSGCDSIHPGYGFLSESEDFAGEVLEAGLVWVGPKPATIRAMGVKTVARALMHSAGVPIVPGFQSESADDDLFLAEAQKMGYPVMVKAAGGGGGKGIRIVRSADDLLEALAGARREAQNAFNDPRVFLEKYIENGRHIEVQLLADDHGNILHLYERECSAQRRHQKIIEETPSPLLTDATRAQICEAAVNAGRAVNYVNAGTVEFIATPSQEFYFLEMNTRLQVEHPITELVTGVDIVKWQFKIASGEALSFTQADIRQRGHAIECRIYAEDAHNNFLPAIGQVQTFIPPIAPNVRVDTGLVSGDHISIYYDPMIAKLIVYDENRDDAIGRMKSALRQTVLLGTTTNIDFLLALLDDPIFATGQIHTAYIDANLATLLPQAPPPPLSALFALLLSEATMTTNTQTPNADSDSDRFSPWGRTDAFRIQNTR